MRHGAMNMVDWFCSNTKTTCVFAAHMKMFSQNALTGFNLKAVDTWLMLSCFLRTAFGQPLPKVKQGNKTRTHDKNG